MGRILRSFIPRDKTDELRENDFFEHIGQSFPVSRSEKDWPIAETDLKFKIIIVSKHLILIIYGIVLDFRFLHSDLDLFETE